MSAFDEFKGKAEEFIKDHPDQVHQGVDRAGDFVDEKTGGKYEDQVNSLQEKAAGLFGDGNDQAANEQSGNEPNAEGNERPGT